MEVDAEATAPVSQVEGQEGVQQEAAAPLIVTPEAVKAAEQAALNIHKKLNLQSAPIRQYLESSVVPTLMAGLQALCKERPENPVEYLAYYLLSHNPQGVKPPPAVPATAAPEAAAAAAPQ